MKTYTDLEQSKKLAEILPIESADMLHCIDYDGDLLSTISKQYSGSFRYQPELTIPCWSLAALLDILECPVLQKDKIGDGKEAWMVSCYPDGARVDSYWNESPIDACVKMIVKLKKENFTKI